MRYLKFVMFVLCFMTAQGTVYYVSTSQSGDYVWVSGVTDTEYAMGGIHTAYATVAIESPTGRQTSNSSSAMRYTTADSFMPINNEDGLYTGTNTPEEYCPVANTTWSLSQSQQQTTIKPWVKLVQSVFVPSQIEYQSKTTQLRVDVETSLGCAGAVTVAYILTPPTDMQLTAYNGSGTALISGNSRAQIQFGTGTSNTNNVTGTVNGHTYIYGFPTPCEIKANFGDQYPVFSVVR